MLRTSNRPLQNNMLLSSETIDISEINIKSSLLLNLILGGFTRRGTIYLPTEYPDSNGHTLLDISRAALLQGMKLSLY